MCSFDIEQKFGRQVIHDGTSNQQKRLNGFNPTIYFPTNWRNSGYEPLLSKTPNYHRLDGGQNVIPDYYQKNYIGLYPMKLQPLMNDPQPYTKSRFS